MLIDERFCHQVCFTTVNENLSPPFHLFPACSFSLSGLVLKANVHLFQGTWHRGRLGFPLLSNKLCCSFLPQNSHLCLYLQISETEQLNFLNSPFPSGLTGGAEEPCLPGESMDRLAPAINRVTEVGDD